MKAKSIRPSRARSARLLLACLGLLARSLHAQPQDISVVAHVNLVESASLASPGSSPADLSNVVIWLTPADRAFAKSSSAPSTAQNPRLIQRGKNFEPHLLVVEVGTVVQFPNKDPFFHNIFSLYNGKPFDLGLYEAGSTRSVRFDRPGASFLFCNIHAEMSAVVVAVDTPYFGLSDRSGQVIIHNVPSGRYIMHVWYERSKPEDLQSLTRTITISSASRTIPLVQVLQDPSFTFTHKNKYGQDYVPPPTPEYQ